MKRQASWGLLLCLCAMRMSQAAEADLGDIYSRLVFDVCGPEAARGAPPPDGKMECPGFVVRGPDAAGNLASALQIPVDEKVYMVALADPALARQAYAYLAASRKSCAVVAANLPGI